MPSAKHSAFKYSHIKLKHSADLEEQKEKATGNVLFVLKTPTHTNKNSLSSFVLKVLSIIIDRKSVV